MNIEMRTLRDVEETRVDLDDGTTVRFTQYPADEGNYEPFDEMAIHVDSDADRFTAIDIAAAGRIAFKLGGLFRTVFVTEEQARELVDNLTTLLDPAPTARV